MDRKVAVVGICKASCKTRKALIRADVRSGDKCVIKNDREILDLGEVLKINSSPKSKSSPEWEVVRKATERDIQKFEDNEEKVKGAKETAQKLAKDQGLPMNIIGAEYSLERRQLKFYFKAPRRVDFRGLLKELAHEFTTRIELEQVGPREAAAVLGGIGRCGRRFCCQRFLEKPGPVPMEVAQKQELSVSPDRLTGVCGRLLCCLKFEEQDYEDVIEEMPELHSRVRYKDQKCKVVGHNVQEERVRLEDEEGKVFEVPRGELN